MSSFLPTSVAFQNWFPGGASRHPNVPLVALSIPVIAANNGTAVIPLMGSPIKPLRGNIWRTSGISARNCAIRRLSRHRDCPGGILEPRIVTRTRVHWTVSDKRDLSPAATPSQ